MSKANATVTLCRSKTPDLKVERLEADILAAATATEKTSYTTFVPKGVRSMTWAMIMVSTLLTAQKRGVRLR